MWRVENSELKEPEECTKWFDSESLALDGNGTLEILESNISEIPSY